MSRKYYFCYTIGTDFKKKIQKLESFENINKIQLLEIAQRVYDNYDSRDKIPQRWKSETWERKKKNSFPVLSDNKRDRCPDTGNLEEASGL